jgi:hypothetical protein
MDRRIFLARDAMQWHLKMSHRSNVTPFRASPVRQTVGTIQNEDDRGDATMRLFFRRIHPRVYFTNPYNNIEHSQHNNHEETSASLSHLHTCRSTSVRAD